MGYYVVTWKSNGVHRNERIRADSEEEAKSKSRSLHQKKRADFTIVSVKLGSNKSSIRPNGNQPDIGVVPIFKQFACSFSVMNSETYEAHQIALYALDEASAKETLHHDYPNIIMRTIHVVEAS